jgi:hypothetical protein
MYNSQGEHQLDTIQEHAFNPLQNQVANLKGFSQDDKMAEEDAADRMSPQQMKQMTDGMKRMSPAQIAVMVAGEKHMQPNQVHKTVIPALANCLFLAQLSAITSEEDKKLSPAQLGAIGTAYAKMTIPGLKKLMTEKDYMSSAQLTSMVDQEVQASPAPAPCPPPHASAPLRASCAELSHRALLKPPLMCFLVLT